MRRTIMVLTMCILVGISTAVMFSISYAQRASKLPDLVVDRINVLTCTREGKDCVQFRSNMPKMKFEVTVKNIGLASASVSKLLVKIEVSNPTRRVIPGYVESRVPALDPGRTFANTFEILTPPEGTCELRAIADYGVGGRGEVRESNERNNITRTRVIIRR